MESQPQETDEGCLPAWYTDQRAVLLQSGNGTVDKTRIVCPNGIRLPGDVTWSSWLSTPENIVCSFYGYVPMLVIVVAIVEFLYVRGTRELFFVLYVAVTTALNELVLKSVVQQPRPALSCATTCGMPSSHSTFATGFFIVMFLDAAFRVNPMDVPHGESALGLCAPWLQKDIAITRGPLSNPVTLSNCSFVLQCLQWGFVLLPVPLSRIYVGDHTTAQVVVGALAGVIYGFIFFFGVYEPFAKRMADAEKWRWPRNPWRGTHLLKNTIKLPWWRKKVNPHHISIVDSEPDATLVHGRSLVRVEVPIHLRRETGTGGQIGVVHGQKLQVVGGHWSGVAWPIKEKHSASARDCQGTATTPAVDEKGLVDEASASDDSSASSASCDEDEAEENLSSPRGVIC